MGINDVPATSDTLGIKPYCDGLVGFITRCPTPTTIAIQGDWGSGKTSTMRMVRAAIEEHYAGLATVVDFNTWQWAQGADDNPVYHLVRSILDTIAPPAEDPVSRRILTVLETVGKSVVTSVADTAARRAVGMVAGELGQGAYDVGKKAAVSGFTELWNDEPTDVRQMFSDQVATYLRRSGAERLVIFVDDLDRLAPARAVDVMEALKALLDSAGCVFVLAIDFDVVVQGVTQKYGTHIGATKARAFFDKMIQLPFHMPVAAFDISAIIQGSLTGVDASPEDVDEFTRLSTLACRLTPRAVKRLLNSFVLLGLVNDAAREASGESVTVGLPGATSDDVAVFGYLAIKEAFPTFVSQLEESPEDATEILTRAADAAETEGNVDLDLWDVDTADASRFSELAAQVRSLYGLDTSSGGRDAGIEALRNVAALSNVTSVGGGTGPVSHVQAMTTMPLADRLRRLPHFGVTKDQVELGERLENGLAAALKDRGWNLSGRESSKGKEWAWDAHRPDGRKAGVGKIYFKKVGTATIVIGRSGHLKEGFPELLRAAPQFAQDHGWSFAAHPEGKYYAFNGIGSHDDLAPLVSYLVGLLPTE